MSSVVELIVDPVLERTGSVTKKERVDRLHRLDQAVADVQGPQAMAVRSQDFSNTFTAGGIVPLGGQAPLAGVSTLAAPKKRAASRALVGS